MAKNKVNNSQTKKQESFITEEERNNNPIFKAIYKRIRNLNKKLINIDSLKDLDENSLKPEQLSKIAGRADVENEIKKNEEFALFYKGVLDESGSANDISEELIKIATLIAVGQNIDKLSNQGNDANLHTTHKNSYKPIFFGENEKHLVDRIGDIFGVLTNFLKDPNQYRALQDYISYMPEANVNAPVQKVEEVKQEEQKNLKKEEKKIENKVEKVEKVEIVEKKAESAQKPKVDQVPKEEPKPVEVKKEEKVEVTPKPVEKIVKSNPVTQPPKVEKVQDQHNKMCNGEDQKITEVPQKEAENPENKPQRKNFQENKAKNYNQNNRQNNTNHRPNNNNNYRNRNNYYDEDFKINNQPRYNNNKGHNKVTRKDSGTSLEPTPEKNRTGKPRYIEKE